MKKRVLIAILCTIECIVFTAIMISSMFILFHGALLATPIWAILWTFFAFDVLWLITLKYNMKYRIIFSFISGFSVYHILAILLLCSQIEPLSTKQIFLAIFNGVIQILIIGYLILFINKMIKYAKNFIRRSREIN